MRARTLAGILLLPAACIGAEASACFYVATDYFGDRPSALKRLAGEKESSEHQVRYAARQAKRDWPGEVGGAKALADLLVPNVRPVRIDQSDCGPANEVDLGEGEEGPADLLAGTPYAGRADEFAVVFRRQDWSGPGSLCNAEVRDRFAAHLRRRLSPEALREAYVFILARRPVSNRVARMTAFEGRSRRPPLRWMGRDSWTDAQVRRWLRRQPAGRALKSATDEFWAEAEPLLADPKRICPAAAASWPAARAALVEEIEAEEERRRAYKARKPAS